MSSNDSPPGRNSEVARLLGQIRDEYVAAKRGLGGLAEGARHRFIEARMENMGRLHIVLEELVGDQATAMVAMQLEPEAPGQSTQGGNA